MSSKFKVGDRVKVKCARKTCEMVIVEIDNFNYYLAHGKGNCFAAPYPFSVWNEHLELVTPAPSYQSPVKERVVKEIVAGKYDCVGITKSSSGEWRYSIEPYMTAEQLRHAARVFNDIAEALEKK